jgi:hypothetical protein
MKDTKNRLGVGTEKHLNAISRHLHIQGSGEIRQKGTNEGRGTAKSFLKKNAVDGVHDIQMPPSAFLLQKGKWNHIGIGKIYTTRRCKNAKSLLRRAARTPDAGCRNGLRSRNMRRAGRPSTLTKLQR